MTPERAVIEKRNKDWEEWSKNNRTSENLIRIRDCIEDGLSESEAWEWSRRLNKEIDSVIKLENAEKELQRDNLRLKRYGDIFDRDNMFYNHAIKDVLALLDTSKKESP